MFFSTHRSSLAFVVLFGVLTNTAIPTELVSDSSPSFSPISPTSQNAPKLKNSKDWANLAFVEFDDLAGPVYAGQSIQLRLIFGIESNLARNGLQQLFRKALDLPVQIDSSALGLRDSDQEDLNFTVEALDLSTIDATRGGRTFVLNGELARCKALGQTSRSGVAFDQFEYVSRVQAKRAGLLHIEGPSLRFAYSSETQKDLFGRQVHVDRIDAELTCADFAFVIAPLPERGRPPEFTGAIGRFEISSSVSERVLGPAEHFDYTIFITGEGNLSEFAAPRFDWKGFHSFGVQDTTSKDERRFRYDLLPDGVGELELESESFVYFDPSPPGTYRTIQLPATNIRVRPELVPPNAIESVSPVDSKSPSQSHARKLWIGGCVAIALFWFGRRAFRSSGA
ncbi:MAG: hypothetical protein ACI8TQ_001606 [Planctomycetota bacterium]|jgi:hypothetical protein